MKIIRTLAAAGLLAGFALSFSAPALAQDDENITVTAPYVVHHRGAGDDVSVSRWVKTGDLDLRYDGDVARLQDRISYTAEDVCRVAGDYVSDTGDSTTQRECVRDAVRGAQGQVRRLVRYARS